MFRKHTHAHTDTRAHAHTHTYTRAHIRTHVHTHTHTRAHTHAHTQDIIQIREFDSFRIWIKLVKLDRLAVCFCMETEACICPFVCPSACGFYSYMGVFQLTFRPSFCCTWFMYNCVKCVKVENTCTDVFSSRREFHSLTPKCIPLYFSQWLIRPETRINQTT